MCVCVCGEPGEGMEVNVFVGVISEWVSDDETNQKQRQYDDGVEIVDG